MQDVIVIGGGLAGLATAAALGGAGFQVELLESRAYLGGRATSYPLTPSDENSETIDNCQHVLLRCCTNLVDFYERLQVADRIEFHREFYFIEPGGRVSSMRSGMLPTPLHFTESFARLKFLDLADKISVGRGLLALRKERLTRTDLDRITMLEWLHEKKQTPKAIDRFWRQVLVSAVNEEVETLAALHGFQVFWLGFLANHDGYQMGIPAVPLGELYGADSWSRHDNVQIQYRSAVDKFTFADGRMTGVEVRGETRQARFYVSALPFERLAAQAPSLGLPIEEFTHSPITGIHLWFDRSITDLPHATLLDRTIQWMFNKGGGKYIQLVISASRSLVEMPRAEVIELALRELKEFFPLVAEAKLEKAHVVKEIRATFSARPGLEPIRPVNRTNIPNLFLAGDWTKTGWPATMEGAVRSGYLAAEAVAAAAGKPQKFLLPDIG